jgi:hypothetical protein
MRTIYYHKKVSEYFSAYIVDEIRFIEPSEIFIDQEFNSKR